MNSNYISTQSLYDSGAHLFHGHKYIRKEPNGSGGFNYIYKEPSNDDRKKVADEEASHFDKYKGLPWYKNGGLHGMYKEISWNFDQGHSDKEIHEYLMYEYDMNKEDAAYAIEMARKKQPKSQSSNGDKGRAFLKSMFK